MVHSNVKNALPLLSFLPLLPGTGLSVPPPRSPLQCPSAAFGFYFLADMCFIFGRMALGFFHWEGMLLVFLPPHLGLLSSYISH
jgi:hypothetical protein